MMNTVCVVFDEVANVFSAPMTFSNDESAKRYMKVQASKNDPMVNDLKLYKLGTFDAETGKLEVLGEPELLIRGDQCEKA